MRKLIISWQVYNDDNLTIDEENVKIIKENNLLIYNDDYGKHEIDLQEKTYQKVNGDEIFRIDFLKNTLYVAFDAQNFTFDIEANYQDDGQIIIMEYALGDNKNKIVITRKEEI